MRDLHMFGENPKWTANLQAWGERAVVTVGKNSKTGYKGTKMIFVGYAEQESESVRMWDPSTKRVVVTREVILLNRYVFSTR